MKRVFAVLILMALILGGCTPAQPAKPPAPAGKTSGNYSTVYSGELTTINYLVTATTAEYAVAANCIDTLVEYDHLGVMKPGLAKSWEVSPDGLTWTFKLREGVKWVTWEGKEYAEVVAQDWVDALKYSFDPKNASKTANISYGILKNGEGYFKGEVKDFAQVGVKAVDKYTLQYTLNKPVPYFLTMLTYTPFMPANGKFLGEVGAKFGTDHKTLLYNGAYIISAFEPQNMRKMVKNETYWDKANVFIKQLDYKYNKEASTLAPEMYLRGEITGATIPSASLDGWMKDPAKKAQIHPAATSFFTYFYAFNFNPTFDKQYEPDNWKVAVNNANFRKSIFHALDRKAAMITAEPYAPERRLSNTVTPKNFAAVGGKDYTQIGAMAAITSTESFNKEKAVQFRDKAKTELAGKATFPVKVLMPYNSGTPDWVNRAQVVEQQLEGVLGKEYVDIIPVGFPATNFLTVTRRSGNYALQECNWGPDYADPETYTDPFTFDGTYNKPHLSTGYTEGGKFKYQTMVDAAKAEVKDLNKRFELFAQAEAFLINEAFLIPYAIGGGGFVATKLEPLTCPYAPFGISDLKFKGQIVMEKPMDTEAYNAAYQKWEKARAEALQKAATTK